MQDNTTIARPYAQAVFETANSENKFVEWSGMLNLLESVVTETQMEAVLANPKLDSVALSDFVTGICGDGLDGHGKNLVKVLADAGRLNIVSDINKLYEQLRADAEGVVEVDVVSAYALTTDQQISVSDVMAKRLGKKVEVSNEVDESLIGGLVIRAGDTVIDASVKGRLKALANGMTV